MESKRKGFWPALALFFLAPATGELLSGSAPPAEFFNPFTLFLLAALYGSGAILIREMRVRWDKGWPTVFALGAAYGIIEEGLMVKSFFDPNWMDIGLLGTYGRWAGVNWVWSLELTIYHAIISISIPILLVEMFFREQRDQPWLGRRGMSLLAFLITADVLFGFLFLTPYRPPLIPYLMAIILVVLLYQLARRLPSRLPEHWFKPNLSEGPTAGETGKPALPAKKWFWLAGFLGTLIFFLINWVWPNLNVPVLTTLLGSVVLVGAALKIIQWMSRSGAWDEAHQLALAAGALSFFIVLAPLQEMDQTRVDNTSGMTAVGLAAIIFLIWLWKRVNKKPDLLPLPAEARS
ncbi:MAG: hypothetical protein JXB15_13240 [Anaerolineales bacterium]|nr:hypothetical protein [Anaerolineales bacterium]